MSQTDTLRTDWRSVEALCERLNAGARKPTFSVHALRHHVRQAQSNGLAPAVRRIGRKVLVSESGFIEWINALGADAA